MYRLHFPICQNAEPHLKPLLGSSRFESRPGRIRTCREVVYVVVCVCASVPFLVVYVVVFVEWGGDCALWDWEEAFEAAF